jgi:hypothetical protein
VEQVFKAQSAEEVAADAVAEAIVAGAFGAVPGRAQLPAVFIRACGA